MKDNISAISFLLSSKCNLNCNFCFFNKNKYFNDFNEIVKKAWKDNTYISTILNTLNKLNQSPNNVNAINFWGGETLYDLEPFIPHIQELLLNFPNLHSFWLPTNFSINIDYLVLFLKEIDKYLINDASIWLQLSIDGPIEIAGHKISFKQYEKNIVKFFDEINNYNFNKLSVDLHINAVIEEQTFLKYFSEDNNIIEYTNYMVNLCKIIKDNNKNNHILFSKNMIIPVPSSPSEMTTNDGILLTFILNKWKQILINNFPDINPYCVQYIIRKSFSDLKISYPNFECKQLLNSICILPDGTIAECINHFLMHSKEYQKDLTEKEDLITAKYSSALAYNPNNMDQKELKKHLRYINEGFRNNETTYRCLSLATCLELLKSSQIDESYSDIEKLYKHINQFQKEMGCSSYNHQTTHIPYMSSPGTYRKIFNGVADFVIENSKGNINNE